MTILKLRASFGKLHDELELHQGMNLLCLPNEAGKSTWSAFILAMLYGIDTTERATKGNQGLPAKERYKPWDGSPMEGSMEVLWQGRHITIERSSSGRVPMGNFRAYETESGIPVTGLTGENCGRVLCGVERSVFERTAFIRQLGLSITEDAALEKRLGAMVSTGEEGAKTYLELEKELRNRKNKLVGRVGRIPQLSAEKERLERNLQELYGLQEEAMELNAKKEAAAEEQKTAQALLERIHKAHEAQKQAGLRSVEEKIAMQEALCQRLEATAETLPPEEVIHDLQRKLESRQSSLQTAKMDAAFGGSDVEKPMVPQGFGGLNGEEAKKRAKDDASAYEQLSGVQPKKLLLPLVLCLLLLCAGIGLCFVQLYPGLALAAVGLLGGIITLVLRSRSRTKAMESHHQAQLVALRYGLTDCDELQQIAEEYARSLEDYEERRKEADLEKEALARNVTQAQTALEEVLEQVRQFAPQCMSVDSGREILSAAQHTHEQILTQRRTLDALHQQHQSLRLVLGGMEQTELDAEALLLDEAKIAYEERSAGQRLPVLTSRLDQIRGAISAMGDPVEKEAELERLEEEIAVAGEHAAAIDLAMTALKSADEELRSRFSPQITAEAGALLGELTEGKYPRVLLQPDMGMSVREENAAVMRPAAAMSCGTYDQMYLALRLAMGRRLLPADAPLLLDDALVNFDDARAAAALKVLRDEADQRQVILFTCHSREGRM